MSDGVMRGYGTASRVIRREPLRYIQEKPAHGGEQMDKGDFAFEFHSKIPNAEDGLKREAERRLRELTKGHKDLIGASVVVEGWANKTTTFVYRARVVAFIRPDNLAAEEKADTPEAALKGALDGVTRQIREQREKLRERWKQR